ncbi:hypothetical protein FB451DRAFT_1189734 [Mycena latifolia]|nr:hypothetical protein FB451DRAFT_1189734 [Mycena latifolia]
MAFHLSLPPRNTLGNKPHVARKTPWRAATEDFGVIRPGAGREKATPQNLSTPELRWRQWCCRNPRANETKVNPLEAPTQDVMRGVNTGFRVLSNEATAFLDKTRQNSQRDAGRAKKKKKSGEVPRSSGKHWGLESGRAHAAGEENCAVQMKITTIVERGWQARNRCIGLIWPRTAEFPEQKSRRPNQLEPLNQALIPEEQIQSPEDQEMCGSKMSCWSLDRETGFFKVESLRRQHNPEPWAPRIWPQRYGKHSTLPPRNGEARNGKRCLRFREPEYEGIVTRNKRHETEIVALKFSGAEYGLWSLNPTGATRSNETNIEKIKIAPKPTTLKRRRSKPRKSVVYASSNLSGRSSFSENRRRKSVV